MPRLTEVQLKAEKPGDKPRKVYDERGLFLLVNPDGSMYWRVRYTLDGKEKLTQLGVYRSKGSDLVTMRLSEARERRDELREMLSRGIDPAAHRNAEVARLKLEAEKAKAEVREAREARRTEAAAKKIAAGDARRTVRLVAEEWLESYRPGWSVKHAHQNHQSLRDHVYPLIGYRPIRTIGTADILDVLQALLREGKAETARRVRQRLAGIFQFAALREYIDRDPVPLVAKEFTKLRAQALKLNPSESFACIGKEELPALLRVMNAYPGVMVRLALRLMMLTLARTSEIRGATWDEFYELDGPRPLWRIPPERMKAQRGHDVPLSRQAVEVLNELRPLTGDCCYLFPHERKRDKPLSENGMLYALWSMGYRGRMTGHGFRALGSTILNEAGFRTVVIERALAHEISDKVEAAYNRAEYLDERREMLQWYANYLGAMVQDLEVR
ncbi:integrase arm-type DNA-binding domain-containing protein [Cupriavidus gilardii]|uniref:Integrase arm-type DNA-binding domain-containing protein n=1 Tax=Cupriavidus gilardii TaxID=82541 RepID=A0ABY4VVM2_9BURK|nr:integrase arm-type DNA-binding domain-containing protein [Cupriavidus gilardii]USE81178.1 integrase arm-type DNA-binding domain-containing protein [Cupriavidus gilardii]